MKGKPRPKFSWKGFIYTGIWGGVAGTTFSLTMNLLWFGVKYAYGSMDKTRQRQVDNLTDAAIYKYAGKPAEKPVGKKKVATKRRKYSAKSTTSPKQPAGSQRPRPTKVKD